MAHSCGLATLDEWKRRMGPRARAFFDRFESLIAACGEYHVAPATTRIAFMAQVRFASITSLTEERMVCGFSLPRPLRSQRISRVEEVVPGWWVHRLHITELTQLDDRVAGWLRRSYRLMGMRERLKRSRRPLRSVGVRHLEAKRDRVRDPRRDADFVAPGRSHAKRQT
jgi:hypothetical protein